MKKFSSKKPSNSKNLHFLLIINFACDCNIHDDEIAIKINI